MKRRAQRLVVALLLASSIGIVFAILVRRQQPPDRANSTNCSAINLLVGRFAEAWNAGNGLEALDLFAPGALSDRPFAIQKLEFIRREFQSVALEPTDEPVPNPSMDLTIGFVTKHPILVPRFRVTFGDGSTLLAEVAIALRDYDLTNSQPVFPDHPKISSITFHSRVEDSATYRRLIGAALKAQPSVSKTTVTTIQIPE